MKTFFQNGTSNDIDIFPDCIGEFCVQKTFELSVEKYIYTGDSIKYELDGELVLLYDKLRDLLFDDINEYNSELDILPAFIQNAGYNSNYMLDKEWFLEQVDKYKDIMPNLFKHIYLVDIQFLIATVQNLLDGMDYSFTNYFVQICNVDLKINHLTDDSTQYVISQDARYLSSLLESYFTKAYSILDILTKICFEFENKSDCINRLTKAKSSKILWGDRTHLTIKDELDTIFVRSNTVKLIESLRNEFVHNGSLEQNPKVYISIQNDKIVERYMLLPDFVDGNLVTVKNRKRFFSNGNKVNNIFPEVHFSYLKEILCTIKYLNAKY